jgi:hypothetical protein
MRRSALVLLFCLAGGLAGADLSGNWSIAVDRMVAALKASPEYQGADADRRSQMDQGFAQLPQLFGQATFRFDAAGVTLALTNGQSQTIPVVKQEEVEGVITLTTRQDGKDGTITITMVDANTLQLRMGGGKQTFFFTRQLPAPTP